MDFSYPIKQVSIFCPAWVLVMRIAIVNFNY
jgi:hypothetical protein